MSAALLIEACPPIRDEGGRSVIDIAINIQIHIDICELSFILYHDFEYTFYYLSDDTIILTTLDLSSSFIIFLYHSPTTQKINK